MTHKPCAWLTRLASSTLALIKNEHLAVDNLDLLGNMGSSQRVVARDHDAAMG